MLTKRWHGLVAACMLGGLCIIIGNSHVEARGSSAVAGTSQHGGDRSCFNEGGGGVRNDCPTARYFVLPAIYDNSGGMTIQVAAAGVGGTASLVTCVAISVNSAGESARWSTERSTEQHTGATEYLQMFVNAHGWGATYAHCRMDPGTWIRNYHY